MSRILKLIVLSIYGFSSNQLAAETRNFKDWESYYVKGEKAGRISSCVASASYSNAYFSTRLFADEMDFIFYRSDFTLPYNEHLGSLIFRIDGVSFLVTGGTTTRLTTDLKMTAQVLYIDAKQSDYGSIFNALKNGKRFAIEFPNGATYPVSLRGSGAALTHAGECWSSRPTGRWSNNPFIGSKKSNNPFEIL